jgi:dTDP-4-dehydrorhamnose reductase
VIWLTGSKGMLGTELSLLLEKTGIPFTGTDREVDITDSAALSGFAKKQPFAWIVNCAAYTAVDKAEDDRENCRLLNTEGPANIARLARGTGARLIHISTDYVFDGSGNRPYTEEDAARPAGVYGLTKRDGETRVMEENANSYIIRTAWLYGKHGSNFVRTMIHFMNERDEVKVVNDQRGSPTWAHDLASAIIAIIEAVKSDKTLPFGIYNYTDEGDITWFEFAKEIYRQGRELGCITKDCAVTPCNSADFPSKLTRPPYSVLDKTKIKKAMGIEIPVWTESLRRFLIDHA